jgi:hypothetical protein
MSAMNVKVSKKRIIIDAHTEWGGGESKTGMKLYPSPPNPLPGELKTLINKNKIKVKYKKVLKFNPKGIGSLAPAPSQTQIIFGKLAKPPSHNLQTVCPILK